MTLWNPVKCFAFQLFWGVWNTPYPAIPFHRGEMVWRYSVEYRAFGVLRTPFFTLGKKLNEQRSPLSQFQVVPALRPRLQPFLCLL